MLTKLWGDAGEPFLPALAPDYITGMVYAIVAEERSRRQTLFPDITSAIRTVWHKQLT